MGIVSGPRTNPTIKNLAQTNQRTIRSWQVSLSAIQVALILGIALGGFVCMFYLGFFSGQKVGLELALKNGLTSVMRLPVDLEEESPLSAEESLSQVYARLKSADLTMENDMSRVSDLAAFGSFESPSKEQRSLERIDLEKSVQRKNSSDEGAVKVEAIRKALQEDSLISSAAVIARPGETRGGESARAGLSADKAQSLGDLRQAREKPARVSEQASTRKLDDNVGKEIQAPRQGTVQIGREQIVRSDLPSSRLNERVDASSLKEGSLERGRIEGKVTQESSNSLITDRLPKGWFAQVGAPDNRVEAENLARSLRASGFSVLIEAAKVRGQDYFRVLVGPEETRQQAERLLTQLKREKSIRADPFIRMVR